MTRWCACRLFLPDHRDTARPVDHVLADELVAQVTSPRPHGRSVTSSTRRDKPGP